MANVGGAPSVWPMLRFASLVTLVLLLAVALAPPANAVTGKQKKVVTYRAALQIDSKLSAGMITATGTTKADVVLRPVGDGGTAWEGTGPITVENEQYAGIPMCMITKAPTTGTLHVSAVKSGGQIEVNWSAEVQVPSPVLECAGGARSTVSTAIQPFLLTEPHQFTVAEAGGSQQLTGGMQTLTNKGTLTLTRREECEPKVTAVRTYPPGQQTSLSGQAGNGLGVGDKLTADVNVELEFADDSIVRMAKGAALMQDDQCGAFDDKSRSFKGTLLLGKIWFNVTKAFGGTGPNWETGQGGGGVRGTTYWIDAAKSRTVVSVSKHSVWVRRRSNGRLVGPKVIVKAGWTAVIAKTKITLRRTGKADAFPAVFSG